MPNKTIQKLAVTFTLALVASLIFMGLRGFLHSPLPSVTAAWIKVKTQRFPVQIIECHDGDTCRIQSSDGWKLQVRFAGIDAPELAARFANKSWPDQSWGQNSLRFIHRDLLRQKVWFVEPVAQDRYGRHLVWIYSSATETQPQQISWVASGWAHSLKASDHRFDAKLWASQEAARFQKRGLWSQNPREILEPKDFRSLFNRNNPNLNSRLR